MDPARSWLLFTYQVPASPSTHRYYVWRKLKALGALYLQNSICLLPSSEGAAEQLRLLHDEIVGRHGSANLFPIRFENDVDEGDIVGRFVLQMDDEYREFIEECAAFHAELAKERSRNHLTFGELEENDEDLKKLRSWLAKLHERDFFSAGLRDRALEGLESCEEDFRRFEAEVEAASTGL